jgi:hypothetical protein
MYSSKKIKEKRSSGNLKKKNLKPLLLISLSVDIIAFLRISSVIDSSLF